MEVRDCTYIAVTEEIVVAEVYGADVVELVEDVAGETGDLVVRYVDTGLIGHVPGGTQFPTLELIVA